MDFIDKILFYWLAHKIIFIYFLTNFKNLNILIINFNFFINNF